MSINKSDPASNSTATVRECPAASGGETDYRLSRQDELRQEIISDLSNDAMMNFIKEEIISEKRNRKNEIGFMLAEDFFKTKMFNKLYKI